MKKMVPQEAAETVKDQLSDLFIVLQKFGNAGNQAIIDGIADDTVVATVAGIEFTAKDFKEVFSVMTGA